MIVSSKKQLVPRASAQNVLLATFRSWAFSSALACWTALLGLFIPLLVVLGSPPRRVRQVSRLWARGTLVLSRCLLGIRHSVKGWENRSVEPSLILCNHQSAWETIAALVLFPDVAIVAKRELLKIPVFGWFLKHSPMIIIDRASSVQSIRAMARESQAVLAAGRSVLIFPEGTRVAPDQTISFRRGIELLLRVVKAPVLPVVHDAGRYWRSDAKAPGTIQVRVLPALDRRRSPSQLVAEAEAQMIQHRP